ncbi:MAG: hypothetical protein GKR90_22245 [Pseudomonadales bacterium]|nr:hypothetical protein [Pseudomonadales bacterium]
MRIVLGILIGGALVAVLFYLAPTSSEGNGENDRLSIELAPSKDLSPPVAAFSEVIEQPDDFSYFELRARVYVSSSLMTSEELVDAIEQVIGNPDKDFEISAIGILVTRLAELDANRALEVVLSLDDPNWSWFRPIFRNLAYQDITQAIDALGQLNPRARTAALSSVLKEASHLSAAEKIELAIANSALRALNFEGEENIEALHHINGVQDPRIRYRLRSRLLALWSDEEPESVFAALAEGLGGDQTDALHVEIAQRWADRDAMAAFSWAKSKTSSRLRGRMLALTMTTLANTDLSAAQEALTNLGERDWLLTSPAVYRNWILQDLDAAVQPIDTQTSPLARSSLTRVAAAVLVMEDPDSFFAWVRTLDEERMLLVKQVVSSTQSQADFGVRAQFLDEFSEDSESWQFSTLVRHWAAREPKDAASWIESRPHVEQVSLYETLTQSWGSWDARSALEFAKGLEDRTTRDSALLGLITLAGELAAMEEAFRLLTGEEARENGAVRMAVAMEQRAPERAAYYERLQTR